VKFGKKHITNLDVNELIDGLDRFGCRKVPNQENGRDLVLKVASKEMVQKSQYVSDAWQETSMLLNPLVTKTPNIVPCGTMTYFLSKQCSFNIT